LNLIIDHTIGGRIGGRAGRSGEKTGGLYCSNAVVLEPYNRSYRSAGTL
jgi:hypothetical protein